MVAALRVAFVDLRDFLRAAFRLKGGFRLGLHTFFRYGRDPVVRAALRGFPLSWRRPFLAAAVFFCRVVMRGRLR